MQYVCVELTPVASFLCVTTFSDDVTTSCDQLSTWMNLVDVDASGGGGGGSGKLCAATNQATTNELFLCTLLPD